MDNTTRISGEFEIEFFDDVPKSQSFIGTLWISGKAYRMVEAGDSIPNVFKELGVSLEILRQYEKNKNKTQQP